MGNSSSSPNRETDVRREGSKQMLEVEELNLTPYFPLVEIHAGTEAGILNKFGWGETGSFQINTFADELKRSKMNRIRNSIRRHTRRQNSITESTQAFPTIKELAQLSQHAYKISDLKKEEKVPFKIDHMADWICIGTGRYSDGYCGAAYVNYKHSHVVIAHGGTEFKLISKPVEFFRDFVCTDVGGVVLGKDVSQFSSAYIFTKIIVNLCSDTQFSISVTGHSLGGWLAQISAFYIAHPNYISQNEKVKKIIEDKQKNLQLRDYAEIKKPYHLHTVSFDSPGCREALIKIVKGRYCDKAIEWKENVETLDFTVILSSSNIVNTWGEHVGYVLTLEMPGVQDISWITASHGIQLFVDHLSPEAPELKEVHDVHYRNTHQSEVESIIIDRWFLGRWHSCQAHIFSPKEIEFLTRAQLILKWRNKESLESSDMTIFKTETHKKARTILEDIKNQEWNDFVQEFTVRHNTIFGEKILNEMKTNMSKLIWKMIKWFRHNRDWLNGHEFQHVIQDLPGCRQMFCESEGSLYKNKLPKLKAGKCTTPDLCAQVTSFLGNSGQHFLHFKAGNNGRQSRLYMLHVFNCLRRHYKDHFEEHTLFINILSLQRLSLEIKMAEIFSQTNFRLIVVECDSEINEEMNAVINGMIANVISAKMKLVLVIRDEIIVPAIENVPVECNVDPTLKFENLDEPSKKVISHCHVKMHGYTFMLGKSDQHRGQYLLEDVGGFLNNFNSSEIICDIFDGKIIDLSGGSLPVMAEHYIPRTLFQITLNVEKLKGKVKYFSDTIVVSNSETSIKVLFPELIPLFDKDLIYELPVGEYTKVSFLNDCSLKFSSRNVHWFKVEKVKDGSMFIDVLVWQMSNGQPCFDYLKNVEGGIPDSDLHELKNNFIILADEPGMGKSAAITKLFLEYRNTHFNSKDPHFNWPVYINLNDHQVELKDTTYSYDSALQFLVEALSLDRRYGKLLFKFCLEKIGNVKFFIDSFDEISEKGQNFVVQMLQQLKVMTHSRIRVWIATRNYAKYELEQRLGTKSYRFHRIEEPAQKKFLVDSWTHKVSLQQIDNTTRSVKLAEFFADRAITEIRKVLGTDHTFIGIPLQLVLLAQIYNDKFLQLLKHKLRDGVEGNELSLSDDDWKNYSDKFSSTLELYDLFVEKKLNIWLEDKFRFDTRTDWMDDTLRARMNKIHSHAAFLYISSSILTNSDVNVEAMGPGDSYEVNRVGFCEKSESNFRFYHQTIAEYFTAKFLVNLIRKNHKNNVVAFLKTHYHQPYFKRIRHFLDSLLCIDIPVLKNIELLGGRDCDPTIESLCQHFTNLDWDRVDALGRNILHYAMAYGNHHFGIVWMIAKAFSLFDRKDRLGEACLSYFCLSKYFQYLWFPHLEVERDILRNENFGRNEGDLTSQITEVPVLYSIFSGTEFQLWLDQCISREMDIGGRDRMSETQQGRDRLRETRPINYETYIHFQRANRSLLTKSVEINMTWLAHCTENENTRVHDFLSRLCRHNSLDENLENIFLDEWFDGCLSDKVGDSYKLGAKLIFACRKFKVWDEFVLGILRNNLPSYYHNAFPYMSPSDENNLWKSCLDVEDRRKMLLVMENYNFYSLFRLRETMSKLLQDVINFVYKEMNDDKFKAALNKGLVNAFHVYMCKDYLNMAYNIYDKSDDQARKQMIKENFIFQSDDTTNEEPELIVNSAQTFKDIIDGKDSLWTLKPLVKIKENDFQNKFFTLPVKAEYPNTSNDQ